MCVLCQYAILKTLVLPLMSFWSWCCCCCGCVSVTRQATGLLPWMQEVFGFYGTNVRCILQRYDRRPYLTFNADLFSSAYRVYFSTLDECAAILRGSAFLCFSKWNCAFFFFFFYRNPLRCAVPVCLFSNPEADKTMDFNPKVLKHPRGSFVKLGLRGCLGCWLLHLQYFWMLLHSPTVLALFR